jgi:hypothetical protein
MVHRMDLIWERLPLDVVYVILEIANVGKLRSGAHRSDCRQSCPARFMFRLASERIRTIESLLTFPTQTVRYPSPPQSRIVLVISSKRYIEIRRSHHVCEVSLWEDPYCYRERKTAYDTWRVSECPTRTLLYQTE